MGNAILDQRGGDSLTATTLDGYSLLADTTVSSATTTVNFTGLNIGWGDELLLVSDVVNNSGSDYNTRIYVNGNTTNSNYYYQHFYANGSNAYALRNNTPDINYVSNNQKSLSQTSIKQTNSGYFVAHSKSTHGYGISSIILDGRSITSTFTISSITSLTVSSGNINGINIGSRFQLYKSGGGASRTWAIT